MPLLGNDRTHLRAANCQAGLFVNEVPAELRVMF